MSQQGVLGGLNGRIPARPAGYQVIKVQQPDQVLVFLQGYHGGIRDEVVKDHLLSLVFISLQLPDQALGFQMFCNGYCVA